MAPKNNVITTTTLNGHRMNFNSKDIDWGLTCDYHSVTSHHLLPPPSQSHQRQLNKQWNGNSGGITYWIQLNIWSSVSSPIPELDLQADADSDFHLRETRDMVSVVQALLKAGEWRSVERVAFDLSSFRVSSSFSQHSVQFDSPGRIVVSAATFLDWRIISISLSMWH